MVQLLLIIALIWAILKFPFVVLACVLIAFIDGAISNRKNNIIASILNVIMAILVINLIVWLL